MTQRTCNGRVASPHASAARERTVTSADGRRLAIRDWGPIDGPAVIAHHGTPSSSLWVPGGWQTPDRLGIRVITWDRPGYGNSTPQPGRRVADAADDARAIVDRLGIDGFAVIGYSGGGPHALACGALLREAVTRVCIVGGAGPVNRSDFDFAAGLPTATVAEMELARRDPDQLRARISEQTRRWLDQPEQIPDEWKRELPAADREVLGRPDVVLEEAADTRLAFAQGPQGWFDDDLALVAPWGFEVTAIEVSVALWYGEDDVLVPAAHGRYLAERLPDADLHLVSHGGHWLVDEVPSMLEWLVGREAVDACLD